MSRIGRTSVALAMLVTLALATAGPVAAVFSVIQTDLTGPEIGGRTPRGSATIDQSQLPAPGILDLRVNNLNLPNGTVLTVIITDCVTLESPDVGTITLQHGTARATLTLPATPSVCQVGHNSAIFLELADGTIVLEGGAPWEVRRA